MKGYLSLIPILAKAHRRENRMTLLCIVISVFLVTAVFSLAEMGVRMEGGRLVEKHGAAALRELLNKPAALNYFLPAGVLFALILLSGVLMISGSMSSSVARRTRFFGMMRCLGMSRRQVFRYVRMEALNWCVTAIPAGAALGTAATWAVCAALRFLVGEEFAAIPVFGLSSIGIVIGGVTGLATVLLASASPARRAAAISPKAALTDDAEAAFSGGRSAQGPFKRIETALGVRHAVANRKSFLLLTGSFALSIILFLCFSVLIELVGYMMPQSAAAAQMEISSPEGSNSIDPALSERLLEIDGVRQVYGRRSILDLPAVLGGESVSVDIISFDDFDLDCLKRDKMLKRGGDISPVYGDGGRALAIWDDGALKAGDTVALPGGTLEICGFLKYDPFSVDGFTHGKLTLICSGETFMRLTAQEGYSLLMLQTDKELSDESVEAIRAATGGSGALVDLRERSTANTYTAFVFFIYAFLALIALVTVLNIMNSVYLSVCARTKQYGVMRALGMSGRQIKNMIKAEAVSCALSGCAVGCALGLGLSRLLYETLITSHYGFARWSVPLLPLGLIFLFILLAVFAAVRGPTRRVLDMQINETVNSL